MAIAANAPASDVRLVDIESPSQQHRDECTDSRPARHAQDIGIGQRIAQ